MNMTKHELTQIESLYSAIFEGADNIAEIMPENAEQVFWEIAKDPEHGLTEREQKIIEMRFFREMDLGTVGKEFGVTRERIRQVEAKALRKMRHPYRRNYLLYGRRYKEYIYEGQFKRYEEMVIKRMDELFEEEIESNVDHFRGMMKSNAEKEALKIVDLSFNPSKGIDDLGFSVRTFNCLKRAQINTLGQLVGVNRNDLKHIRNLGIHSINEIIETVRQFKPDFCEEV